MDTKELAELVETGNKTITALRAELDGMKSADVLQAEKLARMEKDLADTFALKQAADLTAKALDSRLAEVEKKAGRPGGGFDQSEQVAAEHKTAFMDYLRKGQNGGAMDRLFALQEKAVDVRVSTNASGGFALPKVISDQITKMILDISPIRSIARVVQVGSPDYHEIVDANGFGAEWLGETDTRNQTNTPNLFDVAPTFGEMGAKPEATRQSINDLFFDVEAWLVNRGAEAFAIAEGLAFVSGSGTNRPTGFLAGPAPVATGDASRAVGTLQYIPTGQAAALAAAPFDNLKDMIFSARAGYRPGSQWVMNSLTMATLAKVKDTQNRYLLQTDVAAGTPYMMEGYPVLVAEDMPIIAANAFPIAFGNFARGYLIADIAGMWMVRDEVTKPGWIRYPMSRRVGGRLLDTNAIKLLRISVS
jgi:HK97 family phage major capsid protein